MPAPRLPVCVNCQWKVPFATPRLISRSICKNCFLDLGTVVDDEIKAFVLAEFEAARIYLVFHFSLKFAFATTARFQLYGMASTVPEDALRCWLVVKAAIATRIEDPRLKELQDNEVQAELEQWEADGCYWDPRDPVSKCPRLREIFAELLLCEAGERWVEAPHAKTQKAVTKARQQ